ncbi:MAG: DUF2071 domain-containing protein [Cyclobacteriaceae bacterium]|nr:DUF2071 domain-containing protein [Cyclobacteriaceae bacterium]
MIRTFLKAEWRKLAMANYEIDAKILEPYLPYKTEIDLWENKCYVSLVGFMFEETSVLGIKVPFHTNFEEVNLRFYVRFNENGNWKRGVVFMKEIVPRSAITWVANTIYGENYECMPMDHIHEIDGNSLQTTYRWKKQHWNSLTVITSKEPYDIAEGSEEEFITEHYWGYAKKIGNRTLEYGVEHPRWQVYKTKSYSIDVDFGKIYGPDFGFLNQQKPSSVFLAEGSEIEVKRGVEL